jgi:HAMP domain-containing protein
LRQLLCKPLERCPDVLAISQPQRGVWIRLQSSLEPVWLFYPLPLPGLVSRDPLTLSISLIGAGVVAAALFLTFEVQRPMRRLVKAMAAVGSATGDLDAGSPVEGQLQIDGALEVRRLTDHFNAMLARLQAGDRERQTMLAGIAHDLNSPITRLRLRLGDRSPLNLDGVALAKMAQAAGCSAAELAPELLAWLGPCIGPQAFEVGAEVRAAFMQADPSAARFFAAGVAGKYLADLPGLARARLCAKGPVACYGNDGSADWCTVNNSAFFSHRRSSARPGALPGETGGRMAACIWLV